MNISQLTGKRIFVIGNGGSYANACHIVNDLLLKGIAAFTIDGASLTCSANDFGYDTVFERWLKVVARPSDVLIALSGSGKSPNIVNACAWAEANGLEVIRRFGMPGGLTMQEAEEEQLMWMHDLCFPKN